MAVAGSKSDTQRTLAALRLAAGGTSAEAAVDAHASERTVQRWQSDDPAFRAEIGRLRGEILGRACGLMAASLVAAGDKLREHLNSADERISLRAAIAIHELALDLKSATDDGQRLDELERRIMGQQEKPDAQTE